MQVFFAKKQKDPHGRTFLLILAILTASKVCECTVCFGHTMAVFLLLEGGTCFVVGIDDFSLKTLSIRHARAFAGGTNEPHHSEVELAMAGDWEWNLIVSTTNTAGLNFEIWANILDSLFENLNWVFALKLLGGTFDCTINSALSNVLFTIEH
jgi:hypothetical protein